MQNKSYSISKCLKIFGFAEEQPATAKLKTRNSKTKYYKILVQSLQ